MAAARLTAIAGLVTDAYVPRSGLGLLRALAPVNEGILFRPCWLALLAAAALVLPARGRAWRLTFAPGLVISAGALALMLVSRYADLASFGPFPNSYGPVWFPEKLRAAPPVIVTTDFRLGR